MTLGTLSTLGNLSIKLNMARSVAGADRNKPVSLNQLRLCCKGSGVSKSIFWGGFLGSFQNNNIFLQPLKFGSMTGIICSLIDFN
jgi:hypothetical protein